MYEYIYREDFPQLDMDGELKACVRTPGIRKLTKHLNKMKVRQTRCKAAVVVLVGFTGEPAC